MLPGVSGKADYVEVALDEVDDHVLPHILLVLCRGVVPGRSIYHVVHVHLYLYFFYFRKKLTCISSG